MAEAPGGEDGFEDPAFDDAIPACRWLPVRAQDAQIRAGSIPRRAPDGEVETRHGARPPRLDQGAVPSLRATVQASRHRLAQRGGPSRPLRSHVPSPLAELQHRGGTPVTPPTRPLAWVGPAAGAGAEQTSDEISSVLAALDGRFRSRRPERRAVAGMAHALPTGRNFYSLDPRAVHPDGVAGGLDLAIACSKPPAEEGRYPSRSASSCGHRRHASTSGDDVAEALALMA